MRTRLTLAGIAILSSIVAACSPAAPQPRPSSFTTRWPIKHVVIIVKENRSFDHMFGQFPGANGVTVANDHGRSRSLAAAPVQTTGVDLPHHYSDAIRDWNNGKMDGFRGDLAFTQFGPYEIPNYWHWAEHFVLADNFFASVQGSSLPNHLFTIAADSAGTKDIPINAQNRGNMVKSWGCDTNPGAFVWVYEPDGDRVKAKPCFDIPTMGDRLTAAGIPWASYAATTYQRGYIWSAYNSIRQIRETGEWQKHVFGVDDVIEDIREDRLPSVTWIQPRGEVSEHPEYSMCHGENWSTQVIDAIMQSPMWKDTAIFLSYDDWGGFYDHVPPPLVDDFGFGIRVPFLMISPYALEGVVDHRLGEFSSMLRFIENNWSVEPLTSRDRVANDLAYDFDFTRKPRPPDVLSLRPDCTGPTYLPDSG